MSAASRGDERRLEVDEHTVIVGIARRVVDGANQRNCAEARGWLARRREHCRFHPR